MLCAKCSTNHISWYMRQLQGFFYCPRCRTVGVPPGDSPVTATEKTMMDRLVDLDMANNLSGKLDAIPNMCLCGGVFADLISTRGNDMAIVKCQSCGMVTQIAAQVDDLDMANHHLSGKLDDPDIPLADVRAAMLEPLKPLLDGIKIEDVQQRIDELKTTQEADPVVVIRRSDLRRLSSLAYNLSQELYRLSEDTHDPASIGSDALEPGNSDQPGGGGS